MALTSYERRVLVPQEIRVIYVQSDSYNRTVYVTDESRIAYVQPSTTSAERTVYASED